MFSQTISIAKKSLMFLTTRHGNFSSGARNIECSFEERQNPTRAPKPKISLKTQFLNEGEVPLLPP
jgi:hypothetical protein